MLGEDYYKSSNQIQTGFLKNELTGLNKKLFNLKRFFDGLNK